MGLLFRANSLLKTDPARGGLLKQSLQVLNNRTTVTISKQKIIPGQINKNLENLFHDFRHNITAIKSEIDLINYIAASFVKFLHLKKLVCLMLNPVEDKFTPWISIGFIRNSLQQKQKLVFPRSVIAAMFKTFVLQEITGNKLANLEEYFMPEDFALMRQLALMPFFYKDTLLGFILMADLNTGYSHNYQFREIFANFPIVIEFMRDRAQKVSEVCLYNIESTEKMIIDINKQLEYAVTNKTIFKILFLSIETALAPVLEDNPKINSQILKEELLLLLGQLFKHIGHLYNLKDGNLLFTINKLRKFDIEIMKDQLLKTVCHYFSDILIENDFNLDFQVSSYPEDGESVEALLAAHEERNQNLS